MQEREREVRARLDLVTDPELDEPITDMGFVEDVAVEGDDVLVCFRLPTYWCSPNFAFLMAEGIRREVGRLPWAGRVTVRLEDHMCAEEMNATVNAGGSFAEAFSLREEGGNLDEVRRKFDGKAFHRRQEAVLLGLRAKRMAPRQVAAMTLAELREVEFADPDTHRQQGRYLAILGTLGLAFRPEDPAFPDLEGRPLTEAGYADRMSALRAVRINMEFGGALCRGLKASRYQEVAKTSGEPTLVDFILERVPSRVAG